MRILSALTLAVTLQLLGLFLHYYILSPTLPLDNLRFLVAALLLGPLKWSTLFLAIGFYYAAKPKKEFKIKQFLKWPKK